MPTLHTFLNFRYQQNQSWTQKGKIPKTNLNSWYFSQKYKLHSQIAFTYSPNFSRNAFDTVYKNDLIRIPVFMFRTWKQFKVILELIIYNLRQNDNCSLLTIFRKTKIPSGLTEFDRSKWSRDLVGISSLKNTSTLIDYSFNVFRVNCYLNVNFLIQKSILISRFFNFRPHFFFTINWLTVNSHLYELFYRAVCTVWIFITA